MCIVVELVCDDNDGDDGVCLLVAVVLVAIIQQPLLVDNIVSRRLCCLPSEIYL